MSCIGFTNPTQRAQIASAEACAAVLPFSSPEVTEAKRRRLVTMARSPRAKVRAAAAGNPATPQWVLEELADDEDVEVRRWVVRNQAADPMLVRVMAGLDPDAGIRAFAHHRSSV